MKDKKAENKQNNKEVNEREGRAMKIENNE